MVAVLFAGVLRLEGIALVCAYAGAAAVLAR